MFRADSLSDVIWQYGAQYVDTPSGLVVPDYDLAEKYQYNGLFSKIVDRPAEEALKHGMEYNVGDPQLEEFLDDALDRLDWEDKATTAIRWASPSAMAVFPPPGSPTSAGLFLFFRHRMPMTMSISRSLPITGSMPDALRIRSSLNCSRSFVVTASFFPLTGAPCSQCR